jgi:hypothetical protein
MKNFIFWDLGSVRSAGGLLNQHLCCQLYDAGMINVKLK